MTKYILEIGTPSAFKGCSPIENIIFDSYKEAEKWFHKAMETDLAQYDEKERKKVKKQCLATVFDPDIDQTAIQRYWNGETDVYLYLRKGRTPSLNALNELLGLHEEEL